jgi:hypothetical protein
MNGFLYHALPKQFEVPWKAIEFLAQPVRREHRTRTTHLCLAEDERKNRNVQIHGSDAQHSPGVGANKGLHPLQDFQRVILLPFAMEGKPRIQSVGKHFAGNAKNSFNGGTYIYYQPFIHIPDRQQLQQLHRVPSSGDFIRLLFSIERLAGPAVFLQLVVESDPVDIKHVRSVALIAATPPTMRPPPQDDSRDA